MDFRQLEAFCAIVEWGSFSEASKHLFTQTSHPKNIHIHNNIAVMQPLTSQTDRRN